MFIKRLAVHNFRQLKDVELDLEEKPFSEILL